MTEQEPQDGGRRAPPSNRGGGRSRVTLAPTQHQPSYYDPGPIDKDAHVSPITGNKVIWQRRTWPRDDFPEVVVMPIFRSLWNIFGMHHIAKAAGGIVGLDLATGGHTKNIAAGDLSPATKQLHQEVDYWKQMNDNWYDHKLSLFHRSSGLRFTPTSLTNETNPTIFRFWQAYVDVVGVLAVTANLYHLRNKSEVFNSFEKALFNQYRRLDNMIKMITSIEVPDWVHMKALEHTRFLSDGRNPETLLIRMPMITSRVANTSYTSKKTSMIFDGSWASMMEATLPSDNSMPFMDATSNGDFNKLENVVRGLFRVATGNAITASAPVAVVTDADAKDIYNTQQLLAYMNEIKAHPLELRSFDMAPEVDFPRFMDSLFGGELHQHDTRGSADDFFAVGPVVDANKPFDSGDLVFRPFWGDSPQPWVFTGENRVPYWFESGSAAFTPKQIGGAEVDADLALRLFGIGGWVHTNVGAGGAASTVPRLYLWTREDKWVTFELSQDWDADNASKTKLLGDHAMLLDHWLGRASIGYTYADTGVLIDHRFIPDYHGFHVDPMDMVQHLTADINMKLGVPYRR